MTFNSHFHQLLSPFSKEVGARGERNNGRTETQHRKSYSHLARSCPGIYTAVGVSQVYKCFVLLTRLNPRPDNVRSHSKGTSLSSSW